MLQKISWFFCCLNLFFFTTAALFSQQSPTAPNSPVILLQTFGTKKSPGRSLSNTTERALTIKLAEKIQEELMANFNIKSFIINPSTHTKNQFASFNSINRIKNAVVIQFSITETTKHKPTCRLFYRCYNKLTDEIKRPSTQFETIPVEDIYLINFKQSKSYAKKIHTDLTKTNTELFETPSPLGIPLANINGVKHPVIWIEIESNDEKYLQVATPLASAIAKNITP